jgi:hypothetical protein
MLGVLIAILCLDRIAVHRGLSRQRHIPLVLLMRVSNRPPMSLSSARILASRQTSSLRPLLPLVIHSVNLRNERMTRSRYEVELFLRRERAPAPLESGASAPHDAQKDT